MKFFLGLVALLCICGLSNGASWWPWQDNEADNGPEWNALSVTWMSFSTLPVTVEDAVKMGWKLNTSKCQESFFYGHRYILNNDPSVMLLYDSHGKIAGFQMGILKSTQLRPKFLPWYSDGNMIVATVYFTDPKNICDGTRPNSKFIGDKLLFQTGLTPDFLMEIPLLEKDVKKQKVWVPGKCFWSMGMHYWYNVSKEMDCTNFFPLFIMYNNEKLNAFGFVLDTYQTSPRFEHPTPTASKLTFASETRPKCLDEPKPRRSSMHVYLQKRPFFNMC